MSAGKNLVGFGMSVTLLAGGALAVHEMESLYTQQREAQACVRDPHETKPAICDQYPDDKEYANNIARDTDTYGVLAFGGIALGGIGAALTIISSTGVIEVLFGTN